MQGLINTEHTLFRAKYVLYNYNLDTPYYMKPMVVRVTVVPMLRRNARTVTERWKVLLGQHAEPKT